MSSRTWGNSDAPLVSQSIEACIAGDTGVVTKVYEVGKVWYFDVRLDHSSGIETLVGCEMLQSGPADTSVVQGRRVLVAILGSGKSIILGLLPTPDATVSPTNTVARPTAPSSRQFGPDDRVFEGNGSYIVFTSDGDIKVLPKRALRSEATLTRLQSGGDASDAPVSGKQFLAWAAKVDAVLAAHEEFIVAWTGVNQLTTPHPIPVPQALPTSSPDMLAQNLNIPTGG